MAEARQLCRLKVRATMTNNGSDGSGVTNGGSDPRLGRGARAAGANRVMSAVVWLSQTGHSGSAGLRHGDGKGNGEAGAQGSEAQGTAEAGRGK